jgi:hypothetical protein
MVGWWKVKGVLGWVVLCAYRVGSFGDALVMLGGTYFEGNQRMKGGGWSPSRRERERLRTGWNRREAGLLTLPIWDLQGLCSSVPPDIVSVELAVM